MPLMPMALSGPPMVVGMRQTSSATTSPTAPGTPTHAVSLAAPEPSGQGLAVVNAVVRAHQGELKLQSRLGRGTCALLSLPLIPHTLETN